MTDATAKVSKRLLETISGWQKRRGQPTRSVQRDIRIMILNGVCMTYHRNQFLCRIMPIAEYESVAEETIFFREGKEAAEEIAKFLSDHGCCSEAKKAYAEGENGKLALTLTVETSGISHLSKEDIDAIRDRHWSERSTRMEKEGGPRKRKRKKRGNKKK